MTDRQERKIVFREHGLRYDLPKRYLACAVILEEEISVMPSVHLVSDEEATAAPFRNQQSPWMVWVYLAAGALLLAIIGTWLVWLSTSLQRKYQEEDIRAACQRVMPDTAERCFDTVVIQRGGIRR
jgi:hypothetical protein